jgi:hypothetical protein
MSAAKTYLDLVNDVLLELRENSVSTVNYTAYSTLVAKWVNDAKRLVEDAWDWQELNRLVTFQLQYGVTSYDLTALDSGLNGRARIRKNPQNVAYPLAFDVTAITPGQLFHMPADWVHQQQDKLPLPVKQTRPIYFGLERYNDGTKSGMRAILWETPVQDQSGANQTPRTWNLYFCAPQNDLILDTDPIYVPWNPVEKIALDIALNERGEELGEAGTTVDQRVQKHLSDAIGIDSLEQDHNTRFWPD